MTRNRTRLKEQGEVKDGRKATKWRRMSESEDPPPCVSLKFLPIPWIWGRPEGNRVSSAFGNIVPMAFNVARKTLPPRGWGVRWPSRWFQSGWGQEMKAKRLVSGNHQLRAMIIELEEGEGEEEGWRKLFPSIWSGRWEAKAFAETWEWLLIFQQMSSKFFELVKISGLLFWF